MTVTSTTVISVKMKTQIFLLFSTFVVVSFALTDSQKQKFREIGESCKTESGVTEDQRKRMREGELIDDPKVKKHFLCGWKKLGLVDADGKIVENKLHERVRAAAENDEEAETICEKCKKVNAVTPEETVFEVSKCLHKELSNFSPVE